MSSSKKAFVAAVTGVSAAKKNATAISRGDVQQLRVSLLVHLADQPAS